MLGERKEGSMSRRLAFAALAAVAMAGTASAEEVFNGTVAFPKVTGCNEFPPAPTATSMFHPKIPGNQNFEAFSVVFSYSASSYGRTGHSFTSTFQAVDASGIGFGP